jgi:hypothetical protein
MSVGALGQPNLFASYGSLFPDRPKTRSGPPIGTPEIFVPAFFSITGLLISMPYLALLNNALVDQDAFGFLTAFLR